MNGAHWHLVVNHLPIIFPIVGVIVMITGLISKSEAVKRTAFMIFVFGALAAIAAMNTGEGAEELVEDMPTIGKKIIHEHEEIAEILQITVNTVKKHKNNANHYMRERLKHILSLLVLCQFP